MTKPQLWFAGTPEFAAYSLEALLQAGYAVAGVLTQPDRPAGRGRKLSPSAVKMVAQQHGLPIAQPEKLQADAPPFADLPRPDLIIVAAYGLLLPQWFLDYPRLGCINIHASLLPRWRGAAPIQRAIEAGDSETGIGIMQMDKGLDTGAVWLEKRLSIADDDAVSLHRRLMHLGAEALLEALPLILSSSGKPQPQAAEGITYAHKLSKTEAAIDWQDSAANIWRKIRAFNLFPVAYGELEGENLRIYAASILAQESSAAAGRIIAHSKAGVDVACGDGVLRLQLLQFPGKQAMSAAELRNGRDLSGKQFALIGTS